MFALLYLVAVALAAVPLAMTLSHAPAAPSRVALLHRVYRDLGYIAAVVLGIIVLEITFRIALQNLWFGELGQQYRYWLALGLRAGIFLAIFLHKIPEGFTVASLMLASGQSRHTAFLAAIWLGVATVAGILLMGLLHSQVGYALPISAGVTLYVAATDLIPEVNREPDTRMALLVFLGVSLMLLLAKLFRT